MKEYRLSEKDLNVLRAAHRAAKSKRAADRIKAVYLLGIGWQARAIHEALLLDEDSIRNYFNRYETGGLEKLLRDNYLGNEGRLKETDLNCIAHHLQETTYRTAKEVMDYLEREFDEKYSVSGVRELLKRLGFVYKKPQRQPAQVDAAAQRQFIKKYQQICAKSGEADSICFMDTTHPQHAAHVSYGWIKRGETKVIATLPSQKRLTINGAVDIKRLDLITNVQHEMVTAETVKDFLALLRRRKPEGRIHLICDNARYYNNIEVKAYAESMAIEMVFLPPYSPNLNLIERVWLYFKKSVLYNRCYRTFSEFEAACRDFFARPQRHKSNLKTLLTEKFQCFAAT